MEKKDRHYIYIDLKLDSVCVCVYVGIIAHTKTAHETFPAFRIRYLSLLCNNLRAKSKEDPGKTSMHIFFY